MWENNTILNKKFGNSVENPYFCLSIHFKYNVTMRELRFKLKIKRNVLANASKEIDNKLELVEKTIFPIDYEVKTKAKDIDDIQVLIHHYSNGNFYRIFDSFDESNKRLNKLALQLIFHIGKNIKYNSNVIEFSYDDIIFRYKCDRHTINDTLNILIDTNVIRKTNVQSRFVVNHNYIFRGDFTLFVKTYEFLYNGEYAELDEKGRIIIDK